MNMTEHRPPPRANRSTLFITLAGLLAQSAPARADDANGPARSEPPKEPAPAPSAEPSAPPRPAATAPAVSERLPPSGAPFLAVAAGFVIGGGAVAISSYFVQERAFREMDALWPTATVKGCPGGTARCGKMFDALETAGAAYTVEVVALAATAIGALSFFYTGIMLERSRAIEIQAAPTVGGFTIRGTF